MKAILPVLIFILISGTLSAQFRFSPASSSALGGAVTALPGFWSGQENPAAFASLRTLQAGIGYDNKYLIGDLSTRYIAMAAPLPENKGTFNFSVFQFGFKSLSHERFTAGYARSFGKNVFAGLNFALYQISSDIEEYNGATLFSFDAGIQYKFSESLFIGGKVSNLNQPEYGISSTGRIPVFASTGIAYKISSYVLVVADVYKSSMSKANVRVGVDYKLNDIFNFRLGYLSNPGQLSFGFGFTKDRLTADIVSLWHQTLGFSPGISISYKIGHAEKEKTWF